MPFFAYIMAQQSHLIRDIKMCHKVRPAVKICDSTYTYTCTCMYCSNMPTYECIYISLSLSLPLSPSPSPSPSLSLSPGGPGTYSVVQCGAAGHNVRSKPSMKGVPIGRLAKDNKVQIVEEVWKL